MTRRHATLQSRAGSFALRTLSLSVLLACDAGLVWALPTDPAVVAGQVSVQQPSAGTMVLTQTTDKAIVNWRGFAIDVNETVRFVQPGSQSAILNRVTGFDPSRILGQMQGNGRVFLINPNGIVFGQTARVDVGSLVAFTLAMSDADFMAGRYLLSADAGLGEDRGGRGPLAGKVVNEGRIRATNGDVVLVGREVANTGLILAEQGRVGLAAVSKVLVDVEGDGLLFFEMAGEQAGARLDQLGEVKAVGGSVELMASARAGFADTVLNMSGVVQARGLGNKNGRIVIDGGGSGITRVSGTLDASGLQEGEKGGSVTVLGDRVGLMNGARIDARGDAGGGTVRVGGDYQGQGHERRSSLTYVAPQVRIDASATRSGDGGKVIVWSDGVTAYHGGILAMGGPLGGHGGFAEVSGKRHLDFLGQVDLSAARGERGTLLLDPVDLEIGTVADLLDDGATTPNDDLVGHILLAGDPPASGTSKITADRIEVLLNTQNVSLAASHDITVKEDVDASGHAGAFGLTLVAGNALNLQKSIKTHNGAISLTSGAGGITQSASTTLNAGSATVTLDAGGGDVALAGTVVTSNATAGAILIDNANNLSTGALTTGAAGKVTLNVAGAGTQTAAISTGTLEKKGAGTMTLSQANGQASTVVSAGTLSISNDNQLGTVPATATPGNLALNGGTLNASGNVTLDAKRGISLNGGTIDVANTKTLGYAGVTTGTGLTKTGAGELALTGANTHVGDTTVSAGKLTVGAGSLAAAGNMVVNAAGTLAQTGDNTVASLKLNGGTLTGTGHTLTAATYELNGGTVNTTLGAGTLTQASNTTTLAGNGNAAAATVNITGGTLALGASDRLNNAAVVTVSAGATLDLGAAHNETVGSLVSAGTIAGTGPSKLTAATYEISEGTIGAKLGLGTFNKTTSGTATLNGDLAAATVNINAGALTVGAAGTLDAGATINVTGTLTLASAQSVNTLNLTGGTLGGTGQTMTVSNAVDLQSGTLNANLAGAATVLKTTAGTVSVNGTIANAVVNVNAGLLTLGAADRIANTTAVNVNGGQFDLGGATDTVGAVTLQSGEINNGTLTGASYAVQSGTIAANLAGGAGVGLTKTTAGTVILTGANTYGATTISAGTLQLGDGGTSGSLGTGAFANGGTLSVNRSNGVTVTAMTGTGALRQDGSGTTTLAGVNTYQGDTTVNHGVLATAGAGNLSANSAVVVHSDGALTLAGNNTAGSVTLNGGTINGTNQTLTAATYGLHGGTVNSKLGAGTLVQASGTTTLKDTVGAGTVDVNGGTLVLNAAGLLGASSAVTVGPSATLALGGNETVGSFALNNGTLNGTGHTLTASTYGLAGGIVNANLGAGTLTQTANTTTLNGTAGATQVHVNGGTLLLGANNRLAGTANITVSGGTLGLGGFSQTTVGDVVLASGSIVNGALSANRFDVRSGAIDANLSGGAGGGLFKSTADTVVLTGTNSYGDTTISGGNLQLGNGGTLGSAGNGVIVNNGTLTIKRSNGVALTDLSGSGNLVQDGSGTTTLSGPGIAYSGATTVNAGTLSGPIGTGALTINSGATLALTGDTTVASMSLNQGTLSGTGHTLSTADAVYTLHGGTVDANLGAGTLTQAAHTTTLNGTSGASTVNLTGGTLAWGASNRLDNSAAVTVASGATLALGASSNTVGTLNSSGDVSGSGTLTATSYTLNAGTVSANLGTGTLTKATAGTTVNLDGTSAATTVNVNGGTLALGSAGRLHVSANVGVSGGATLSLNGNENVATVAVNSGTLGGAGSTLSASTYGLQSATVHANLGAGTLTQSSGMSTLGGTSTATTVNITGGTLALGASDRLSNTAAVSVSSGATLAMGANSDTVGTLNSSGNVSGSGTLTATAYTLNAGTVSANLGTGILTKATTGTVNLDGTAAATTVNVNAGTLAMGSAGRLHGGANVVVNSGAALSLNGNESVATVAVNSGTLGGTGTLSASTYGLQAATVNANLGAGTVTQVSGTTTLNGTSAAGAVNINGGTLVLASAERLSDTAAVNVAGGAQLTLGGNEAVGSLTGAGTMALGAHTLSAGGNGASTAFSGNLSGTGGLNKQGSGTLDLSGPGITYSGATTVNAGTLSGPIGTGALTINSGATLALTGDTTVASMNLNQGTLSGTGHTLSTADAAYTLHGGTVNANLGAGTLTQAANTTTLNGTSSASTVNATGGTLTLGAAERLADAASVNLSAGTQLNLGGNETIGSLAGNGHVALGASTLTTGGNGTSTLYGGVIAGTGGLSKQGGGTFTLGNDNTYQGLTTISAGTLQVGHGGASGTLGSGAVVNNAALVFQRSDNHTVANNISGSGSLTQAGSQTLTLSGTTTLGGAFLGSGNWHILNTLTAGSLVSTGNATLGADVVTTAGGQTYTGTVTTTGDTSLSATGDIVASHTGNNFTAGRLSLHANAATVDAGNGHSLRLHAVNLAADSGIHAGGQIALSGPMVLSGGTLTLTAHAAPGAEAGVITDGDFAGKPYNLDGQPIAQGGAAIVQTGGTITTVAGSTLSLQAPSGGSILIEKPGNAIEGQITAVSGLAGDTNQARFRAGGDLNKLGFVRIDSTQINSAGIEGDVVKLSANSMTTPSGVVRARLPYNNLQGTLTSLPALTFVLKQPGTPNLFGTPGGVATWLQVSVGNGVGGYLTIRPQNHGLSATAVWLAGAEPPTPFYDGAGKLNQIPVYYNGKAPSTPQAEGALSAVTTVIEDARRARFDEAVRTENVSSRLRTGVIAEVGAGRPATEGGDSIQPPPSCSPQGGTLTCAP